MPREAQGALGLLVFLILVLLVSPTAGFAFVGGWTMAYLLVSFERRR